MQARRLAANLLRLPPLERQLRRLRAFATFTYPFACVPFLFPFFAGRGLDPAGYGEILSAYYLAMFVAEVPTGMLADRIGPQRMLVLGPLLLAAGFATLVLWPCYEGFLCGEILLGLGHAVLSGPPSVVLYELLKAQGVEQRYLAEESRMHSRRLYGTGLSFLLGGLLVRFGNAQAGVGGHDTPTDHGYQAAVLATSLLCAAAAAIALGVAPPPHRPRDRSRGFVGHVVAELRVPAVRWLCCYWVVLFALLRFPFHDYQPYLMAVDDIEPLLGDAVLIGLLFATLNLVAAPLSNKVPKLVERHGRRPLFWGMPIVLAVSMAVMAGERFLAGDAPDGHGSRMLCWLGVAMFFVQQVPFAMHWPLLYEFVNHRIGSAARTTVLSLLSLSARAVYAGVNVLLFRLQDARGLGPALATAALGGLAATALVLWLRPRGLLRGEDRLA